MKAWALGLVAYGLSAQALMVDTKTLTQPSPVIYHYGNKKVLIEDARLDAVPAEAWKRFIMGDEGSYKLPPYRRGLYGCPTPGWAEYFADSAKEPWLIGIRIKPECLKPPRVSVLHDMPKDERFKSWLKEHGSAYFLDLKSFIAQCYRSEGGRLYPKGFNPLFNDPSEACNNVTDAFYRAANIGVVYDYKVRGCWYLRDQTCIQEIKGSPEEVVEMTSHIPNVIVEKGGDPGEDPERLLGGWTDPFVRFRVFASALASAKKIDPVALKAIELSAPRMVVSVEQLRNMRELYDPRKGMASLASVFRRCGVGEDSRRQAMQDAVGRFFVNETELYNRIHLKGTETAELRALLPKLIGACEAACRAESGAGAGH